MQTGQLRNQSSISGRARERLSTCTCSKSVLMLYFLFPGIPHAGDGPHTPSNGKVACSYSHYRMFTVQHSLWVRISANLWMAVYHQSVRSPFMIMMRAILQMNTCGHSLYVASPWVTGWICPLWIGFTFSKSTHRPTSQDSAAVIVTGHWLDDQRVKIQVLVG